MKITLMKFGAAWCGPCVSLAKKGTLERFAVENPEVKVEVHDDSEEGSKAYERLADKWKIRSIPTLIWVAGGEELFRSQDVTITGIRAQYEKALKKVG